MKPIARRMVAHGSCSTLISRKQRVSHDSDFPAEINDKCPVLSLFVEYTDKNSCERAGSGTAYQYVWGCKLNILKERKSDDFFALPLFVDLSKILMI